MSDETRTWYENSQINFGLVLSGKRPVQAYNSCDFFPPYDRMLEFLKEKDDWSKEDLYGAQFAPSDLDSALHAVMALNGSAESIDWPSILRKSAEMNLKRWESLVSGVGCQKSLICSPNCVHSHGGRKQGYKSLWILIGSLLRDCSPLDGMQLIKHWGAWLPVALL